MRQLVTLIAALLVIVPATLAARADEPLETRPRNAARDDVSQGNNWTRELADRSQRGTLHDRFQYIRGDSGKWNDEALLLRAPPIERKPEKLLLDDWFDQLLEKDLELDASDDSWLLFRTQQFDDNDRVWIERIERRGAQFTVVLSQAIWQGRYQKSFTYFSDFGVNLGRLEPGEYHVKWIIKPLVFTRFDGDGRPRDNWPQDERPAEKKPVELRLALTVAADGF